MTGRGARVRATAPCVGPRQRGAPCRPDHTRWHRDPLQHLAVAGINPPQITFVAFPGAVPELAVDPSDPGDETIGLDGAQYRPGFGIDLMDLAVAMLPDPQRAFGPRQPRAAAAGRRNGGEYAAGVSIDLLDAVVGDLIEVPAVEGGSRMRGDRNRAQRLAARRIERLQRVAGGKPDMATIKRHPIHVLDARKGPPLHHDLGR